MLDLLGEAALRTVLLAATVQLGLWLFRVRRAQVLLVIWTVVLAASLAMPVLQWATPVRLPVVPGLPTAWLTSGADLQPSTGLAVSAPVLGEGEAMPAGQSWWDAAYWLVSGVLALRLLVGVALSLRLLANAVPIRLMPSSPARTRISRAVAAPVTVGNVILLPPDVVDWPPAMRQAAIAHESAHVARGDFALLALSQVNRALFWFSPVAWLLHRRLALLVELASDDQAMAATGNRAGYAATLLEMGRRSGPLLRGLAMARAATLQYRIERVLSDRVVAAPVSVRQRSMLVVGAAVVAMAAASSDFEATSPGALSQGTTSPGATAAGEGPTLAVPDRFASAIVPPAAALPPPAPMLSQSEDAVRPAAPLAARRPRPAQAASRPLPGMPVALRPLPRQVIASAHAGPPTHALLGNNGATTQSDGATRGGAETLGLPSRLANTVHDPVPSIMAGGAVSQARFTQRDEPSPMGERSLLADIDQQTCDAVYLPGSLGGAQSGSGWAVLNTVRAKFFRAADGKPWLKFYVDTREPVNLPVTVSGTEVGFTAAYNTAFKILPRGTNHLTGITERPYGTIDFACGTVGAHIFDRKS